MVQPSAALEIAKPKRPLLKKPAISSGTIRKFDDAGLDDNLLSAPQSPNKRARVTFNPTVEEKVMEEFRPKGRSLESVRLEVKSAIEGHLKGDSEGYDSMKEIFAPKRGRDEDDEEDETSRDTKTYLLALTSQASLLNRNCNGLVKSVLAFDWMGRDESLVKAYVYFLGSLASAQGAYVGLILGMLVGHFQGGKLPYPYPYPSIPFLGLG